MIFVAVGTTDFDALIRKIDEIAPRLPEKVVMQIGNGQYVPQNCQYIRFAPSLDPYYDRATIVVSHGGLGITTEALERGKKLIGVENTACHDTHQRELLSTLSEEGYLIWCRNLDDLPEALEYARHHELKKYVAPRCEIHTLIKQFLQNQERMDGSHIMTDSAVDKEQSENAIIANLASPWRSKNHMRFRNFVRRIVASGMYYSGALFLHDLFQAEPKARILVYHSISHDPMNPFSVSPEDFEKQVQFLSQKYNVISLEELVAYTRGERDEIAPRSVAITLDDGFEDNYMFAYPILKKYGVPATIFVIVERIKPNDRPPGEAGYLSWDQIVEMSENGISIGSHTLTHPWLAEVSLQEARREIVESKARLEQRLGKPVRLFAYPGGRVCDFNQQIRTIVAESGYTGACVGLNGINGRDTDPYLLRRTKIEVGDGMEVFKKAMRGALDVFVLLDQARRFL